MPKITVIGHFVKVVVENVVTCIFGTRCTVCPIKNMWLPI